MSESLAPLIGPLDLRKDAVTGVIFNANDPVQAAAHPNSVLPSTGSKVTRIVEDKAIKEASPIAGRIVRDINDAKRVL